MPRGTLWRQPSKLRIWKKVKNDKRTDKTATAAPPCGTAVRFKNKWAPHNRCFYLTLLLARASPPSHVPQKFKVGCFLFLYYFIILQLLLPQSFSGRGCGERKEREREKEDECVGEAGAEIWCIDDASEAVLRQLHRCFV